MELNRLFRRLRLVLGGGSKKEINPDETFLDSTNLPAFDTSQFEGRIERPIGKGALVAFGVLFVIVSLLFGGRVWSLQVSHGEEFRIQSENNRLEQITLFADRGVILDRNGVELVWNIQAEGDDFSRRMYRDTPGLSHVLGYVSYPRKDSAGFYVEEEIMGRDGVERTFNKVLAGENGLKILETDALGAEQSEGIVRQPKSGSDLRLSIDARLQSKLYEVIQTTATAQGFTGGAGVILDVENGDILALSSVPEYDSRVLSEGSATSTIAAYQSDERKPYLNRVVGGVYTPGSIVKPFLAIGALEENAIDPEKEILSTGSITVANPFNPSAPSVFVDWKAHGWVNMRQAIAVSSNVYFYHIGGGFADVEGIGISNIEKYMRLFGFGDPTSILLAGESDGTIPNPEWKEANFTDGLWRVGDTYHSAIGQYGFQLTPIQVAVAMGAVANNGTLFRPSLLLDDRAQGEEIDVSFEHIALVQEGLRLAVLEGTAVGLNAPSVEVAAKTGTAELGTEKKLVNSWVVGFFPYEEPRYAFAIIMESGPRGNLIGATSVMRQLFDWMEVNTPDYLSVIEVR